MIGGGEELRAIATANTRTRKAKNYVTSVNFAINPAVGFRVNSLLTFEKNALFLWTGCCVTVMRTNFAGGRNLVPAAYLIDFNMVSSGSDMQRVDQFAASVYSDRLNEMSDFTQYYLFEGNEVINITLTNTLNPVLASTVYVTLCGIEYRQ